MDGILGILCPGYGDSAMTVSEIYKLLSVMNLQVWLRWMILKVGEL